MTLLNKLLSNNSKKCPEKEAVVCAEKRLSYYNVENAVHRMAEFLISKGIKKGDRVGIFCNKDVEEIVVILAILRIGAVFIYINPQYREEQIIHVVRDCDIKAVFVDESKSRILLKSYPGNNPFFLVVSLSEKVYLHKSMFKILYYYYEIVNNSTSNQIEFPEVLDDDPASIIYTSGSTGKAKGIIVTHKIFYDSTIASAEVLNNKPDDRLICVTPFSFDGALSQFYTMFLVGGTVVQQRSNFPKDIVNTLIKEKITGFHAVPSLWNVLLRKHSPFSKYTYPELRYISIIGEILPQKYLNIIREILKSTKVYKMYGTTEAFRSTYLPPEMLDEKPNSVGIPLPGVEIMILDENGKHCLPGELGEIIHRGNFISPGYWNQHEKTAERFKPDGLHTGDLGKLDEDGYLYFFGRKDAMIKIQGFRVSPEEIENCINEIKEIQEAVAISIPGEDLDRKIKAVIVVRKGFKISEKEIINHCRQKLPNYMIPSVIDFREYLPRTTNNKVNKMELI